ncbi:MAG: hypothetical protein WC471_02310 [Candidatus Woesearchaeota archaeon]
MYNTPYVLLILSLILSFGLWINQKIYKKSITWTKTLSDAINIISVIYVSIYCIFIIGFKAFNINVLFPEDDLAFFIVLFNGIYHSLKENGKKYWPKNKKENKEINNN